MEFFIDSANIDEIKKANEWGLIDGVTTNPSLVAKSGRSTSEVIGEIAALVAGPISAEVVKTEAQEMIDEGQELSRIHPNVVIKLPLTPDGLKACKWFSQNKIKTNLTLVFSPLQALAAAKAGATYVSPFIGRLDDISHDGMSLIEEIRTIFDNYGFNTKILAASIRGPGHLREAALLGSDVATIPYKVLAQIVNHPLTDSGLDKFLADYQKSQG